MKVSKLCFALVFISPLTFSETYLCIAEAGAVVESNEYNMSSGVADVTNAKYILTDKDGSWVLNEFGKEKVKFDLCSSSYFCENSGGYGGAFLRLKTGVFSMTWFTKLNEKDQLVSLKGRCSSI